MREFPPRSIAALVDETPRCDLAESYGSDLSVAELLGPDGSALLGSIKLGYRTSSGDPALRALVAGRTGVPPDQVLVTAGAAAALFLVALLFGDDGGEIVVGRPCFPPVLDVLRGVGARVVTVYVVLRRRLPPGHRPAAREPDAADPAGYAGLAAEPQRDRAELPRPRARRPDRRRTPPPSQCLDRAAARGAT